MLTHIYIQKTLRKITGHAVHFVGTLCVIWCFVLHNAECPGSVQLNSNSLRGDKWVSKPLHTQTSCCRKNKWSKAAFYNYETCWPCDPCVRSADVLHDVECPYWDQMLLTLKVQVATIDAQWEGMGDVGSARYEPALLPPCPTIRVLSYSN